MPKSNPVILITGATGNIGKELIKILSAQQIPFRTMVRSIRGLEALTASESTEVVIGDFNDAKTVADALKDVDRAFLLTPSSEDAETQQSMFVDVANRCGVKQIVKLSQWAADADSPLRFLRYHAVVEQKIRDSGIAYT